MVTGAQAVVDCLRREGVDHVFGIPGTMNLPMLDVLRATPEIRFVLTRHEQGAAFMAYGYARALHRPAVVTATEGPGVTNLATGIGAASKIQEALRRAFRVALAEPQGPVHLDASRDILLEHCEPEPIMPAAYRSS